MSSILDAFRWYNERTMKRSEIGFNLASIPLDAGMLFLAGILAFYSRLQFREFIGPVLFDLQIWGFIWIAVKIIPVMSIIFAISGLYNLRSPSKLTAEFLKIFYSVTVGVGIVVVLFFFDRTVFPSRFIILATAVLAILFVFTGRLLLRTIQRYLYSKGLGLHRLIVINGTGQAKNLEALFKNRKLGYEVVKEIEAGDSLMEELNNLDPNLPVDEIFQTNSTLSDDINSKILEYARSRGLEFSFVPNIFDMQRNMVEVESYAGVPVVLIKNTPLEGWGKVVKRLIDIFGSLTAILILSPIFLIIYIAVKLDSKGPAIYSALRGGKGKDFSFYKFRSMYSHMSPGLGGETAEKLRAELWEKNDRGGKDGPFLKIKNDPRVTRVGRIIRKTKLDEIPQFWNVLKGDMSLVGPRAHVLDEVERYRDAYKRMFSIKPGIFGMSQVAQVNFPDLPFAEEIKLNTYYIENWSVGLDIKILIKSAYLLLFGKKPREDY